LLALLVGIANHVVVLMEVLLLLQRVLSRLWLVDSSAAAGGESAHFCNVSQSVETQSEE
jgi:hypothetical protein